MPNDYGDSVILSVQQCHHNLSTNETRAPVMGDQS